MKRLLIGAFALMTTGVFAQGWPTGAMTVKTPAYATPYSVSTNNRLTFIEMDSLTGTLTLNYGTIPAPAGSEIVFKVTAKTAKRGIVFGTNIDGVTDSVAVNKTVYYTFKKLGTSLVLTAKNQIN